jgi:hypothetical protein
MSQLEYSPGPWREDYYQFEMNQLAWCIRDAQGGTVVEGNPYSSGPLDHNGKLIAAAPTMYRILCQICDENRLVRGHGLRAAAVLLHWLEGRSDAEG